jgi:hypothetical protein
MTGCSANWIWTGQNLLLNNEPASRDAISKGISEYERHGCVCGKGLECPLMSYLLSDHSDSFDDEPDVDIDMEPEMPMAQPFPDDSEEMVFEEVNPLEVDEEEWNSISNDDWDDTENNEPTESDNNDDYDFAEIEGEGMYRANPLTGYNEQALVEDVFTPSQELYAQEQQILEHAGAGRLLDDLESKTNQVASYSETTVRLQRENRLLREKLEEMESQVNQQLREIGMRQKETTDIQDTINTLKNSNRQVIWAMIVCLKLLKFLPDSAKMNFRNSQDYRKMLEIYKQYVEPHKEAMNR